LSILVVEFPGWPSLARTTSPTTSDNVFQGMAGNYLGWLETVGDGRRRRKTVGYIRKQWEMTGDSGGRWGTVGDGRG